MSSHHDASKPDASKPSARIEKIKSGVTSPYKFRDYDLQVLNNCTVELDVATLDNLFRDYFSNDSHDSHEKEYKRLLTNNEDHTSSNKKVWITNLMPATKITKREENTPDPAPATRDRRARLSMKIQVALLATIPWGSGKFARIDQCQGPFPGYTHSLVESQNSEMKWSGRPEPISPFVFVHRYHKQDRTVPYYGYYLTNSTRFGLCAERTEGEKADSSRKAKMIMSQFGPGSVNSEAGMKYSVSKISNLCDAVRGTPKDSCTHERYRVRTYSLLEYKNGTTVDEQYPSISIRNRLRNKVAYKSVLSGLGKLLKEPGGNVILAKNKGEIWKLVRKVMEPISRNRTPYDSA
ncbi:uncharacterized protein EAF02_009602 [Botrytis sinoallii]|uniref:uncharacterized protein n=1 Tax=Botrytis sinoallii TaxID=1463999 RepID=UPI0018FFF679|nr:uncharacterized protein EAF02_009602 [Botrytis sinoallii]KAF7868866.1 hypothetical protein EAF02_009602 [Botrytis sinoallii]